MPRTFCVEEWHKSVAGTGHQVDFLSDVRCDWASLTAVLATAVADIPQCAEVEARHKGPWQYR